MMIETNGDLCAQRAVARGAKWLDEQEPDWYNMVTLDTLNQEDHRACVLSQMTGMIYSNAVAAYGLSVDEESAYGFDEPDHAAWVNEEATKFWAQEIRNRREPVVPADSLLNKVIKTDPPAEATFDGVLLVGGKEINIPNLPVSVVMNIMEANR